MEKIVVNAVGEQCPIPVVKATRALREMREPGMLEVHVDNEIAVQNLTRMAAGHHLKAESRQEELPPRTRQLKGLLKPSAPLPADWDYRELLGERMMERFGAR